MGFFCLFYETRHVKLNREGRLNENGSLQRAAFFDVET